MNKWILSLVALVVTTGLFAQDNINENKFRQMYDLLPTPNRYRSASGAPGPDYYQQQADYQMDIVLDDANQRIYGEEIITYTNNSPDRLDYLWVQLDQNMRAQNSMTHKIRQNTLDEEMTFGDLRRMHNDFDGGFKIEYVKDSRNREIPYYINNTMMRVDMPSSLDPGKSYTFKIKWWYNINDRSKIGGRSGLEYFPEEDNYLYTIAQFFPRMCVYNDVEGWQNKQFLGRGEFALPFGDYRVRITAPSDHVVASTGVLQNPTQVLTSAQRSRLKEAETAEKPVMIVTPEEALENEKSKAEATKTWEFYAENVRDFAFASSRKFIWDAMGVEMGDRTVLAMSYYPKEGNPLWERYSTEVVAHTLRVYSRHTFDYPYPVAISVHTDRIGMEYPMICFNGGRPEADGTYSEYTKYGMIGVIIHEVGHNYFPMIVNSDERQWTWMDEGLNTYLQYLTEQEWERNYPSRRGPAYKIVDYMKGDKSNIMPIMTNSESIYQFGNNAYGKPATALNILRETVVGRELFDFAFKQYAQRWMFKHPTPADLFRTLEDASGTDLDWFFRAWFYTTDHVDIAIDDVKWYQVSTGNPDVEKAFQQQMDEQKSEHIGDTRNREEIEQVMTEQKPELVDFYNRYNPYEVDALDRAEYEKYIASLSVEEREMLEKGLNYYQVTLEMVGGIPMPVILEFTFMDGTRTVERIPAEIWKMDDRFVNKVFYFEKEVRSIALDPYLETADVDLDNNFWPPRMQPSRFELYKRNNYDRENKMQRDKRAKELDGQ
jgi:hypothetical protein